MRVLTCFAILLMGAGSAVAKECRMPEVPPGVQVQLPTGCEREARSGPRAMESEGRVRADNRFIDLGNGTKVRVGGRVRVEVGTAP